MAPATPPSTWQLMHLVCTTGPEMYSANTSAAVSPGITLESGAVERFVRCPLGLESRLITWSDPSDDTSNCHLPDPAPSAPLSPSPYPLSSSRAVNVREAPAGTEKLTVPVDDSPLLSIPSTVTSAGSPPGLMTRSRLT